MSTIQHAYTQWSATYDTDRNRTRDLDQEITRKTLSNIRCSSALELGCGTGKNTAFLASISESVLALDFSEGMLAQARQKVSLSNVTFAAADLTNRWPCDNYAVDLIVCNLVLEHIEHLPFIFSEAFRCLRDGGRFFISELHPFRQYQGTQANFQQGQGAIAIAAFTHNLSDFLKAADDQHLHLKILNEWWHEEDAGKSPRIVSFIFEKRIG